MMLTVPQLEMFTGTGATKSLTSAGNDADERLLRNALPKASQTPGGKTPTAVRLMAVSPNVNAGRLLGALGAIGSVTASRLLTAPIELLLFRVISSPQHGNELADRHTLVGNPGTPLGVVALVSHLSRFRVGLLPPLVKSKVTSRWPAVRLGRLVDLEVHVRRAAVVGALPRQVQEVAVVGKLRCLVKAREVALLRRDRPGHDRHIGAVFLGALAERVIRTAAGQIDSRVQPGHVLPVGGAERRRAGQQVAVAAGEGAAGQRPRTRLGGAGRREVTPAGVVREARDRNSDASAQHDRGCQHAPGSLALKKSSINTARRPRAVAVHILYAHVSAPIERNLEQRGPGRQDAAY